MNTSVIFDRLDLIKRFLRARGWERVEQLNDNLLLYQGPLDDTKTAVSIALPATANAIDNKQMIDKALNLLAAIEDKSILEVTEEIANLGSDFLRPKIISPTNAPSLPLTEIKSTIDNLTNLIKYSACLEEDKQPYFSKSKRIGRTMAEKCRFGQTFIGSFGMSIEMPIPPPSSDNSKQVPFERRLMERIARGLMTIRKAVKEADPKMLINDLQRGFNANLYESMQKLIEVVPNGQMEFSFSWSVEYPLAEDLKSASKMRFSAIEITPFLESAAKTLRTCSESEEIIIQGRIIQLQADSPLADDDSEESENLANEDSRLIVVNWENEKGKFTSIRIPLTIEQYRCACDAHRDEKKISIQGTPERKKRFLYLTSPKDFRVHTS
jgi:hypothetical protein